MSFDSRPTTKEHIREVQGRLALCVGDLSRRSFAHDKSKLKSPEVEVFDEFTPKLAASTYGSDEYKLFLAQMKPALDHHYAANSHHPEHYPNGIRGMSLMDVVEMLCDWKAATLRHNNGDLRKSVEINQQRFGYSDELKQILLNTLPLIEPPDNQAEAELRKVPQAGATGVCTCRRCHRSGWELDEFTSPYTGLCAECSV